MKCNTKERSKCRNHRPLSQQIKVNLPSDYPWKVLGWLHDDLATLLNQEDNDRISRIVRSRDLCALNLLEEDWGLQKQSRIPVCDTEHISVSRAKYQLVALLKKFRFQSDRDMRIQAALKKFKAAEETCSEYNSRNFRYLAASRTEDEACIFTYAKSFIKQVIGGVAPTKDIVTLTSRHGPGSNLDTLKGQSNKYFKFENWPYSCTSSALPYARFLIQSDKRWLGALENSYRSRFGIPKHMILNQERFWADVFKIVPGNRITFVPKNAQTERSIAIEPAMNLMLQLGVDGFIRKRLKRFGVDLDSQSKNRIFAYRGSIDQSDDGYVTLDLAAASDSISLKLCELLLPHDWYDYLLKIRSPMGVLDKEIIEYSKISSMGNGFTFALESLIFAAICFAVVKLDQGSVDPKSDYCVFGDDIIVRRRHLPRVVRTLRRSGFNLNQDKSFVEGTVRESCGADWIHGKPVRPIYFDETPQTVMDLFVDINRLKRILELRWGITESKTVNKMTRWIPEQCKQFVGPYSNEDFDTHLHCVHPVGHYQNGLWKYTKLIRRLTPLNGKDFFFRKLMHDLKGGDDPDLFKLKDQKNKWKVNTGGSRFTVVNALAYTVGRSYSVASFWQSDYAEDSFDE